MKQIVEFWPVLIALVGLVPVLRWYTSHMSHRSRHLTSRIDALEKLRDMDVSQMTPEDALVADAALSFAFSERVSLAVYVLLRNAEQPESALKRFKYVSPFIEVTESGDGLRYRERRFLFDKKAKRISKRRVSWGYGAVYFVSATAGLLLAVFGLASFAAGFWVWAVSLIPVGGLLLWVGGLALLTAERYRDHVGAFRAAVGSLLG